MKIPSLLFLCLLACAGCVREPDYLHAHPGLGVAQHGDAPVLYGKTQGGARIGLTNPQPTYPLHQPIRIALYYESPAGSSASRNAPPAGYVGTDVVLLTHPDGTVTDFPGDTTIDGPIGWAWPGPLDIGYQLEKFVHAPGTYKLQWSFGPLASPVISFRVVR
ncbi:MAG TPA: hypothetical protein VGO11_10305 [Chthoniobacteraceae bacterium]|nr:hypothetical protein [Chthoniobacteraceae bacterium]